MTREKNYTSKEFCEIFRITSRTFYRWVDSGKIKVIKIERNYLVPESEVRRLLGE